MHAPPWQVSPVVQALLSLQVVPFGAAGFEQMPVAGAHVPATWHWSDAVQTVAVPPVQAPAWQASPVVQALPSLQAVPLAAFGFEQTPLVGSQVPGTWEWSDAVQTLAVPPVQTPFWQASPVVQALPSLQAVPLAAFGFEQTPVVVSQTPATWHWSDAVQTLAVPPVHAPAWQASPVVQALLSLQVVPLAAFGFEQLPEAGSQVPA